MLIPSVTFVVFHRWEGRASDLPNIGRIGSYLTLVTAHEILSSPVVLQKFYLKLKLHFSLNIKYIFFYIIFILCSRNFKKNKLGYRVVPCTARACSLGAIGSSDSSVPCGLGTSHEIKIKEMLLWCCPGFGDAI